MLTIFIIFIIIIIPILYPFFFLSIISKTNLHKSIMNGLYIFGIKLTGIIFSILKIKQNQQKI